MKFRKVDRQVYYSAESVTKIRKADIAIFKEKLEKDNLQRIRLCTHKGVNDSLHEMAIILPKGRYIQPHKHLNKSESFHLIEGSAYVIIFDEGGSIKDIIIMGDYGSGQCMYYRMNAENYHTVYVISDFLVFHETVQGPFKKSDTVFAQWAPEESDVAPIKKYLKLLSRQIREFKLKNSAAS